MLSCHATWQDLGKINHVLGCYNLVCLAMSCLTLLQERLAWRDIPIC